MPAPIARQRVLPTLNADGTRFRIRPRLYEGRFYRRRRAVGMFMMLVFLTLPLLSVGGKPVILLDVLRREFVFLGHTFLPTDGVLLMLLLLVIFVAIIAVTALLGRAWCGWACPQTVYMEFLFRPVERWIEGKSAASARETSLPRRLLKNGIYLLLAFALANCFLSYFVGARTLAQWTTRSPLEHWAPFLVVAVTTALVFFDFAYFREQMCTVACPYARLQSALLDRKSLIVGYDEKRGEPRGKGRLRPGQGDCIDCNACVRACPTGIDIRQGLQLECIACAQCADACDSIMARIGKPPRLIGYASQDLLQHGQVPRLLRPRVLAYAAILLVLFGALLGVGTSRPSAEVTILRGLGAPFTRVGPDVSNQIRVKIRNRGASEHRYVVELLGAPGARLITPEFPLRIPSGAQRSSSVFVVAPANLFVAGQRSVRFRLKDEAGFREDVTYKLLGPSVAASKAGS